MLLPRLLFAVQSSFRGTPKVSSISWIVLPDIQRHHSRSVQLHMVRSSLCADTWSCVSDVAQQWTDVEVIDLPVISRCAFRGRRPKMVSVVEIVQDERSYVDCDS